MKPAPIPHDEAKRLDAVWKTNVLDTGSEERFDRLTRMATKIFSVPISTLTIVDKDREWFKSCQGLQQKEGDRAISFCGHALVAEESLVVPDTLKDPRFADNPMVTGEPHIRFYAGVPVLDAEGVRLGVFCIKGKEPREFSDADLRMLKLLARWAGYELSIFRVEEEMLREAGMVEAVSDEIKLTRDINRMITQREMRIIELKLEIKALKTGEEPKK